MGARLHQAMQRADPAVVQLVARLFTAGGVKRHCSQLDGVQLVACLTDIITQHSLRVNNELVRLQPSASHASQTAASPPLAATACTTSSRAERPSLAPRSRTRSLFEDKTSARRRRAVAPSPYGSASPWSARSSAMATVAKHA